MACFFSSLVQSGKSVCGLEPVQGQVLYLDYETTPEEVDERLKMLKSGLSLDGGSDFLYRPCAQPLDLDIENIRSKVTEKSVELVVVDSAGYACGGEPESADVALRYYRALRSLGVTTLSIAHNTKEGNQNLPFGSIYWYNGARNIWKLDKPQSAEADGTTIQLTHRKMNNGKRCEPLSYRFLFDDQKVTIEETDSNGTSKTYLRVQIKEVLEGGPMSRKDIVEELKANNSSVGVKLNEYKGKLFNKREDDKWELL